MAALPKILGIKSDMSDWLLHFTKGHDLNAMKILVKILNNQYLKPGEKSKGVISFTESPVYAYKDVFSIFEKYPRPMYSPYGIAVPKRLVFQKGGRHAIYGTKEDLKHLSEDIKWRFVEYDIDKDKTDYTWQREWRINVGEDGCFPISPKECFVILKSKDDELGITFDEEPIPIIEIGDDGSDGSYMTFPRKWKSLTLEELDTLRFPNSDTINRHIESQEID